MNDTFPGIVSLSERHSSTNAAGPTPTVERVLVTPELANFWLMRNESNRPIRKKVVSAFARDMKNESWNGLNGETIKFTQDGRLIDGQHRLAAIVDSGRNVELFVLLNAPEDSQETVDTGTRRGFSDILRMRGEADQISLAAITRSVYIYTEHGFPDRSGQQPSNSELLYAFNLHRESIIETHRVTRSLLQHIQAPASVVGMCFWAMSRVDHDDAIVFFERLKTGNNLDEDDPILVLRNTLTSGEYAKIGWGRYTMRITLAAIIFKAWNHWRSGSTIKTLRFKPGGAKPERFPEPI